MPKPLEITTEFTRGRQWTAAQIKVLNERKTRAELEAENERLREIAVQLLAEISALVSALRRHIDG